MRSSAAMLNTRAARFIRHACVLVIFVCGAVFYFSTLTREGQPTDVAAVLFNALA